MLRVIVMLALVAVVMPSALPPKASGPDDDWPKGALKRDILPPKDKRLYEPALGVKRDIFAKRSALPPKHKRDYFEPALGVKRDAYAKRSALPPKHKRDHFEPALGVKRDTFAKRSALPPKDKKILANTALKREALGVKREVPASARAVRSYTAQLPTQTQTTYYYVLPDGSVQYVQGGQSVPQYQPAPVQPIYQPKPTSSGGFLSFLSNPLNAAGDIVKAVGDTASNIVSLPFKVVDTAIEGVGLGDTGVGQLATGILDVGEAILQTPVNVVSNVAQAPFRLASGAAAALEEK